MDDALQLDHLMVKSCRQAVVNALANIEEVKVELDSLADSPLLDSIPEVRGLAEQLEEKLEKLLGAAQREMERVETRIAAEEKLAAQRSATPAAREKVSHVE